MLKLIALLCSVSPSLVVDHLLKDAELSVPFLRRLVQLMLPESTDYSQVWGSSYEAPTSTCPHVCQTKQFGNIISCGAVALSPILGWRGAQNMF